MLRKMRTGFRTLLIVCLISMLTVAPALADGVPAWINNSTARIYVSPTVYGSLRAGTGVYVLATRGEWAMIDYNGNIGIMESKYLTATDGLTGYVVKSAYVYKTASTSAAKYGPLPVGTELKVVGISGNFYQVYNGMAYAYIEKSAMSPNKPSDTAILASKVMLINWEQGKTLFAKGDYVQIYDIQSGQIIRARRLGGSQHAELEPATAEDTAKILKMCGGKFSWNSRPVILNAGNYYMAAAINCMPHGSQTILDNNFDGQFCLHLPGSKTHETNVENVNHQLSVQYAYAWAMCMQ